MAGHLRPSHTWPDPLPVGASTAARLPVPLHSHLCALRLAYCPPLEGPAPAVSSVGFLQGDLQSCLLVARPGRGLSSPCVSSQLVPCATQPNMLASVQPTDCTHARPHPVHRPQPGHPRVACLLEGGTGRPHLSWHSHDDRLALALMQFVESGKGRGRRCGRTPPHRPSWLPPLSTSRPHSGTFQRLTPDPGAFSKPSII